jgi:hypothetical protein
LSGFVFVLGRKKANLTFGGRKMLLMVSLHAKETRTCVRIWSQLRRDALASVAEVVFHSVERDDANSSQIE